MKCCICFTTWVVDVSEGQGNHHHQTIQKFFGDSTTKDFHPWIGDSPFHPRKLPIYIYIIIYSYYSRFNAVVWVLWVGGAKVSTGWIYVEKEPYHLSSMWTFLEPTRKGLKDLWDVSLMFDPRDIMASSVACFSASSLSFACLRRCWKYILYWVVGGPKSTRRHCVLC